MSFSKPLGEILVEKGYISQQQLDAALSVDHQGKIGELLVGWGFVTKQQIGEALSIQATPPPPPPPQQPTYNPPPPPVMPPPPVAPPPAAPDLTMDTIQTSKFKMDLKTIIYLGSLLVTAITTYFGFTMELNSRFDALEDSDSSAMVEFEKRIVALENKLTSGCPNCPPSRTEYNMKDQLSRNMLLEVQKDTEEIKEDIEKIEGKVWNK